jgi:crotonobetainyl-CoA:carnitine CoA-transferase CaiB-like acyl-CoA transferase
MPEVADETRLGRAPLGGVRVIAVEQFGAGPFGTRYLSDLGADVIKIEDPATGGDVSRAIPPRQNGTDSLYNESFNRGKRSVALDLKTASGQEVFRRLVGSADAVFSNLRGDQPERLGLTYAQLRDVNERIVCVALTGYGRTGPRRHLPAYDALIQAEAGWAATTGEPDGPPTKSGLSLADYIGGLTAALGLLAGIIDARKTGRGRDIDTDLYRSALAMLSYPATWYLSMAYPIERQPLSAHPSVVPFQFFATADGYTAISCAKQKFFVALAEAIGRPDLVADPRFATFDARLEYRMDLLDLLNPIFTARSTAEWQELLEGLVPVAPVRTVAEALDRDDLAERAMLVEYDHPVLGRVRSLGLPLDVGGFVPRYRRAPDLGGDTADLLRELGFDGRERERLERSGAFGPALAARAEPHGDER